MAFRSGDQDYRWPRPGDRQEPQQDPFARRDPAVSLSLGDTLRELALTVAGFVGVILLIMAVLAFGR